MPDFRVFSIDSSNRIASFDDLNSRNDFHAALLAKQVADVNPVEI